MRILYVEDNCELRDTIGLLMEGEGRTVVTCATAEEALQRDAAQPHDVVVSDVSLPGMSGLDLCRHLLASNPQRWVVLCSGYPLEHGVGTLGPHVRSLLAVRAGRAGGVAGRDRQPPAERQPRLRRHVPGAEGPASPRPRPVKSPPRAAAASP